MENSFLFLIHEVFLSLFLIFLNHELFVSTGRFYGGTMLSEKKGDVSKNAAGKVYKYVKGDNPQVVLDNIYISNGMAWDQNNNKFYYIDSGKFDVKEYDYDPSTGNICK